MGSYQADDGLEEASHEPASVKTTEEVEEMYGPDSGTGESGSDSVPEKEEVAAIRDDAIGDEDCTEVLFEDE